MISILFDEAFGDLLQSSGIDDDPDKDACLSLCRQLTELGFAMGEVNSARALSEDMFASLDVLVLAPATRPFLLSGINSIKNFVTREKALLIANNDVGYRSVLRLIGHLFSRYIISF